MKKTPSRSSSLPSKALTATGIVLFGASVAMGANNCSRSEVDYDNRDKEGQAEPTRSAIGALLGVNMRDRCHAVSWGIPTIGEDNKGNRGVRYAISNTLECDWREVRDLKSSNQEFHRPETIREKIAAHGGNTTGGIAGLGIAALGAIAMASSRRRRRKS